VAALGAALLERRRTGRGQYIDVSQVECAIQFVEPLVLDQGGDPGEAVGLDSAWACPHGVYATRGTERYVAIAVETDEQWRALLDAAPLAQFGGSEYGTYEGRLAAKAEVDAALGAWAAGFDHGELEKLLLRAGVPASAVQRMTDLYDDPQLASRGYFVTLEHSEIGAMPYEGLATHFSAKRTMLHKAAPCVGEDTAYVMRELLGMGDAEMAALAERGVFT
jgi:crotonobetainyl-CoA:carnitine CoA-transferase CaiB-like acyl-CoA transferase